MRRRVLNLGLAWIAGAAAMGCAVIAAGLMGWILWRGAGALSWSLLVDPSTAAGAEGGLRYQILGTVILVVTSLALAVPLAVGLALAQTVYLPKRARNSLLGTLHLAAALPSILFGILGLLFFVQILGMGKSWLAGGAVLALMILPTVTVSLIKGIGAIPPEQWEAAAGLGLRRSRIITSVILPQSLGSLATGSLLGLARAAGETAPILFVAAVFSGATLPDGIRDNPVLALPYHIFVLAQDSFHPGAQEQLWGAALVLVMLVFIVNLIALPLRLRTRTSHGTD